MWKKKQGKENIREIEEWEGNENKLSIGYLEGKLAKIMCFYISFIFGFKKKG